MGELQTKTFSLCKQTKVYPQERFGKGAFFKGSGSCLHGELRPMTVQGQPRSPACLIVSLGQEG